MAILNFNFTKIDVERKGKISKEVNVESKMNLVDVKATTVVSGAKQKAFAIEFDYNIKYEPAIGHINMHGNLLYLADEKLAAEIEKSWKAKKVLPKEIIPSVFNKILDNCNIEALILSREIALPAPIQLPKVKVEAKPVAKK
jgi:hypothetical protein